MADISEQSLAGVPEAASLNGEMSPMMSQEQMRANLQDMMGTVDERMGNLNSMKFAMDNKRQSEKSEGLQILFQRLMELGVDPSDVQQVNAFLEKLKAKDPATYEVFERVFNDLLQDQESPPEAESI